MTIYECNGVIPVVHPSAFVHPQAAVTGSVVIGADCYIGPGAALRGDWGSIELADGCNVQENCTVHMFPGRTVRFEIGAHVGHGAVIHGATLEANCLVGMNAVVMDGAVVGAGSIVGALCFVPEGFEIPARKVVVGNPAKIVKDVSDDMLEWKSAGTELYQRLPAHLTTGLRVVEPLRIRPPERVIPVPSSLLPWSEFQKSKDRSKDES
jgi:carbonic anhydrase/acetyltransferase-like protein (isoleucine patch superfamily)